ncbi:endonuclease domain-containing 1 protein-like [Rhinatrema bivittatum]|uniref:endonuclease domain-containing 1 protein-like n=1 Tax=Rhinatrema bivittatum TaxID=194408 RepID=UPI00112742A2|nr:endonuclease domain-containing 1 protein-like [Rhinatrema bivittatum]
MKSWSPLCCLLALALAGRADSKVDQNFNGCLGSFYGASPPQGFNQLSGGLAYICQMYDNFNNPFYASLYSTQLRIPLFSAHVLDFRPGQQTGNSQTFRVEPQLVATNLPQEMLLQTDAEKAIRNNKIPGVPGNLIRQNQSVNADYEGSGYHKGHLNPDAHHPDGPSQRATYTLTNVAPMSASLNSGSWRASELRTRNIAPNCTTMYVVTGVIPGNNWIGENGQQRVRVPSHLWSAYCCRRANQAPLSGGALAQNGINSVQTYSVAQLQARLNNLLSPGANVHIFQNDCQ